MKMCIKKMFPSIACVSIGQALKRFFNCTCKSLHFSLFTESAVVNARPSLFFFAIHLPCSRSYFAAH